MGRCTRCSGVREITIKETCDSCKGKGCKDCNQKGKEYLTITCPNCDGKGYTYSS